MRSLINAVPRYRIASSSAAEWRVKFHTELVVRFNYGATVPWVNRLDDGAINAIAGPERLVLRTPAELYGEDLKTVGEFIVEAGRGRSFRALATDRHLNLRGRRSIHSRRWSARKRFGVTGAIGAPTLGLGQKP